VGPVDPVARRNASNAPWHIDKTVGIQQFKNDRSLSDDQSQPFSRGSIRVRSAAT
jgi:hypothetical protein